jgi:hypothetical protein
MFVIEQTIFIAQHPDQKSIFKITGTASGGNQTVLHRRSRAKMTSGVADGCNQGAQSWFTRGHYWAVEQLAAVLGWATDFLCKSTTFETIPLQHKTVADTVLLGL